MADPLETVTDDDGRFALTWMRSGIWSTMVMAEGYEDAQLRVEVTQNRSNACTPTKMQNCVQPIEYYMVPLKVDAADQVESILAGFDIEETELDRAVAELGAADDAYNRQDYRRAIDGYTSLLARWPQMANLHQDVGDAHRALAQYEEAIAAYERYRAAAPDDPAIERKIARAQLLLGDLAAARDLAAAGGDASPEDLYNLGEVAFSEGDIDGAAGWYEKSAAADPEWPPPVFKLGMVALNRGDIEGAKALFRQVVDIELRLGGGGAGAGDTVGAALNRVGRRRSGAFRACRLAVVSAAASRSGRLPPIDDRRSGRPGSAAVTAAGPLSRDCDRLGFPTEVLTWRPRPRVGARSPFSSPSPSSRPVTAPWAGQPASAQTQSFFVSFTDGEGTPVTDMQRSEVFVETDGERTVALSLEPIRWPLRVTVFVDNGLASPPVLDHMREGLRRFVDAIPADIEVAIGTIGGRPQFMARHTTDRIELEDAVGVIAPEMDGAASFLDALYEEAERLHEDEAGEYFPVIVMVATNGPEGSTRVRERPFREMMERLIANRAALHTRMYTFTSITGSNRRRPDAVGHGHRPVYGRQLRRAELGHRVPHPVARAGRGPGAQAPADEQPVPPDLHAAGERDRGIGRPAADHAGGHPDDADARREDPVGVCAAEQRGLLEVGRAPGRTQADDWRRGGGDAGDAARRARRAVEYFESPC